MKESIQRCVAALQAISLVDDAYAQGPKGVAMVAEIADALALFKTDKGSHGGLCRQVSAAIYRGALNREPPAARDD